MSAFNVQRIAIIGKMHSGKTTLAEALIGHSYTRIAFADPVKDVTAKMLYAFEAETTGRGGYYDRDVINSIKGHPAIRKLLQLVGTELGREWLGPDTIWIDKFEETVFDLESHYENLPDDQLLRVVNDDCRFPNEAERLTELGFTTIKLVRDEEERLESITRALMKQHPHLSLGAVDGMVEELQDHPSETNVDLIEADINIASDSVEQLQALAKTLATGDYTCLESLYN